MYNKNRNNSDNLLETDLQTASHDLNNLLNNVLTGIELLKEKITGQDSVIKLLVNIEQNTLLASDIIQQLSNSKSFIKTEKTVIELKTLIVETVDLLGKDYNNLILIEGLKDHHKIWGNYTSIKRVLINLIINARESSINKSIIQIKLDSFKNHMGQNLSKVIISDNGKGIKEENLNKLFDKGFSTKSAATNRGLGLSIVKSIMQDHNGYIEVNSKKNKGTTFELFFPQYAEGKNLRKIENKKVIVAEDDEFQREVLKDLLKSLKLNVFTASNGIEALELYASTKPDLLFIDDNMPGMTGIECTEKIKNLNNSSPIVLVTGSNYNKSNLSTNISKVLKKPYSFEMIESTIKELL